MCEHSHVRVWARDASCVRVAIVYVIMIGKNTMRARACVRMCASARAQNMYILLLCGVYYE